MKTLLTTFLTIFSLLAFGQNPYQIVDTTKDWNTMSYGIWSWGIYHCGGTKTNKFEEEFIIEEETYLKVFESEDSLQENWGWVGFIREDTVNNLVYFANGFDDVGLIYDFNLEVGDSVFINNYYMDFTSVLVCESNDSVILNGSFKNRYRFSAVYPDRNDIIEVWIEGVGSMFGVLNSGLGGTLITGGTRKLLCCSQNDTVIYMNSVYGECYIDQFYPQIIQEEYDTAYLNTHYEFQLQIDSMDVDSFALIGEVIPEGFSFDEETYLLSGMPDSIGTFPCVITSMNYNFGFLTDMIHANITVVLPTKVQEKPEQIDIKMYPNPFTNNINISIDNNFTGDFYLDIYSCEGILIDKRMLPTNSSLIDCSHFNKGIYLFKLTDDKQNILKIDKLIKK